jgi:cation:H+ antiporter
MGGVVAASLLIAWATEVLSFFLSRGLAFAVLALLQVLPEFAVEAVITMGAATDPAQLQYVTANFTGANRMIVGLFVPVVYLMAFLHARKTKRPLRYLQLPIESSVEIIALVVGSLYLFIFVFTGRASLVDSVFLVGIYVVYLWIMYKLPASEEDEHEELPFVPRMIRRRGPGQQKSIVALLFLFGGTLLFVSVEPFYHNTLELGSALGIGSYFLLQWIAPFLSEFPEFITILYWGRTGRAESGVTNAVSSNIGQLTLLIAMIPIVYLFGTWREGHLLTSLPFDAAQKREILLTVAQLMFTCAAFLNLRLHYWEGVTLLSLWVLQVFDPLITSTFPGAVTAPFGGTDYVRGWVTLVYFALTPFVLFVPRHRFAAVRAFVEVFQVHVTGRKQLPAFRAGRDPSDPAKDRDA